MYIDINFFPISIKNTCLKMFFHTKISLKYKTNLYSNAKNLSFYVICKLTILLKFFFLRMYN